MSVSRKSKKFWKPPSFEDFNTATPTKKIKLDTDDFLEEIINEIPNEAAEPKNISDLAVHPRKIDEVSNWLKYNSSQRAPILLVTGPAGCGKTTTVKVAASADGFSIKEWINPINKTEFNAEPVIQSDVYDKFSYSEGRQVDKFDEFVFKSSRYVSLFDSNPKTLILIEDIPNIFLFKTKQFFEFLDNYKLYGLCPLVFIVTDDQNLNLQNELFPTHIKNTYNITNIKFNPVNNSSMVKNLRHITEMYCPEKVSTAFLENISKNSGGDIRSAVNDLLIFLRTNQQNFTHLPKVARKKSKKNDGIWAESKPIISKDGNFDFYHTIGRILYPKMLSEKEKPLDNPSRMFVHDVHQIADNITNSSINVLHENYLHTVGSFSDVVKCSDIFSVCDTFNRFSELEEYRNLCSVIGLMSQNTNPKKSGFNPMKKPFHLTSKKFLWELETGMEFMTSGFTETTLLLDVIPFLKIIEEKKTLQSSSTSLLNVGVSEESDESNKSQGSDDSIEFDDLEIEEFCDDVEIEEFCDEEISNTSSNTVQP